MGYKIPVEFIKNENGLINNNNFTMLLLILNHENFRSQNMKMEYRYLKNKMDISDNRTIKRVIANLVNLNIISDVEYSMKGEVTIGRIKNYSKDELFKIELELPIRDKHLTRFIFYITYYKYMHLNNFPYDYCMYLSRKNICSALDIEYKKLGSMLRELSVSSSYKEVIDFSEILKERTPLDERIEILEELEGTEEQRLEKYIIENIEEIESGLVFIESQYKIKHGKLDILAKDKNDNTVIIELKTSDYDIRLAHQCLYYPTQFEGGARMITIAPDYREDVLTCLKKINVEMFTYEELSNKYMIKKLCNY